MAFCNHLLLIMEYRPLIWQESPPITSCLASSLLPTWFLVYSLGLEQYSGSMDCDIGCRAEQGQQQPGLEACLKWALKLLESTFHCSQKHLRIASTCPDKLSCEFLLAVAGGAREARGPHTPPLGVLCQCTLPASTASSQNHTLLSLSAGPWSLHTLAWPLS